MSFHVTEMLPTDSLPMYILACRQLTVPFSIRSGVRYFHIYPLPQQHFNTRRSTSVGHARGYATHRDTPSSLLSQQLERVTRNNANGSGSTSGLGANDSIGPFPLGMHPLNARSDKKFIPWSQLTPGGKGEAIAEMENMVIMRSVACATKPIMALVNYIIK